MRCPDCGAEMKPLATSVYCPNDCDRKVVEFIDPEKTEPMWAPHIRNPSDPTNVRPGPVFVDSSNALKGDPSDDPDLDWTDLWVDTD